MDVHSVVVEVVEIEVVVGGGVEVVGLFGQTMLLAFLGGSGGTWVVGGKTKGVWRSTGTAGRFDRSGSVGRIGRIGWIG